MKIHNKPNQPKYYHIQRAMSLAEGQIIEVGKDEFQGLAKAARKNDLNLVRDQNKAQDEIQKCVVVRWDKLI